MTPPPTEEECIQAAGAVLAASDRAIAEMTPREQAEAAYTPSEPFSVDEKEDLIRVRRGLDPIHHDPPAFEQLQTRLNAWRDRVGIRRERGDEPAKSVDRDGD